MDGRQVVCLLANVCIALLLVHLLFVRLPSSLKTIQSMQNALSNRQSAGLEQYIPEDWKKQEGVHLYINEALNFFCEKNNKNEWETFAFEGSCQEKRNCINSGCPVVA